MDGLVDFAWVGFARPPLESRNRKIKGNKTKKSGGIVFVSSEDCRRNKYDAVEHLMTNLMQSYWQLYDSRSKDYEKIYQNRPIKQKNSSKRLASLGLGL